MVLDSLGKAICPKEVLRKNLALISLLRFRELGCIKVKRFTGSGDNWSFFNVSSAPTFCFKSTSKMYGSASRESYWLAQMAVYCSLPPLIKAHALTAQTQLQGNKSTAHMPFSMGSFSGSIFCKGLHSNWIQGPQMSNFAKIRRWWAFVFSSVPKIITFPRVISPAWSIQMNQVHNNTQSELSVLNWKNKIRIE